MALLGLTSRTTFFRWKKTPPPSLPPDTLERLSHVFGIYKVLQILLPGSSAAGVDSSAERRAAVRGTARARPDAQRRRGPVSRPRVSRRRTRRRLCLSCVRRRASVPVVSLTPSPDAPIPVRRVHWTRRGAHHSRASSRRSISSSASRAGGSRRRARDRVGVQSAAARRRRRSLARAARRARRRSGRRATSWRRSRTCRPTAAASATARTACSTPRSASRRRSPRRGIIASAFMRATNEPRRELDMRVLSVTVRASLHDLRGMRDIMPDVYRARRLHGVATARRRAARRRIERRRVRFGATRGRQVRRACFARRCSRTAAKRGICATSGTARGSSTCSRCASCRLTLTPLG